MSRFTESALAGSRPASRVRIVGQRDEAGELLSTRWVGEVGIVVRVHHFGSVLVRFPSGLEIPFGTSDLEVLA
jgi:hypothetical protein